jgi:hypothetical protein
MSAGVTKGRPTQYNEEIASAILAEIATNRVGLATICAGNEVFPEPRTVYRWMLKHDEFSQRYARAKEDQLQILEDEILEIADRPQVGEIVTIKADGSTERKVSDMIEHRKLQIDARKWLMSKLKPKKYGDRQALELTTEQSLAEAIANARKRLAEHNEMAR